MSKKYIAAGNIMVDDVEFLDGSGNRVQLGGPALFALTGIKLWTDNVTLISNVGVDFDTYFGDWMNTNEIPFDNIFRIAERTNHNNLKYLENGDYSWNDEVSLLEQHERAIELGYMKIRPDQIGNVTSKEKYEGLYLAQTSDRVFWDELGKIKKRDNFKIMWEAEIAACNADRLDELHNAMQHVDIFSINKFEASKLFGTDDEESILRRLQQLDVDHTLFRVGERGLYVVGKESITFHPSINTTNIVDPTGSGNNSTGSALYAYCEGHDSKMIGTMANIASSINLKYFGAIPDLKAHREDALALAEEIYQNYDK